MNAFTPTERSRARRRPQRVAYDEAAVYAILDAGVLAHVGYVIDGQPIVTPTSYWREGRKLYWHGAAASRMLGAVAEGVPVCVTVSFLDGFVIGRSGRAHGVNYRAAMLFGRARPILDLEARKAAMHAFLNRLYPGRAETLRPITEEELRMISVVEMTIEEASAKARNDGVGVLPGDEGWPAWAGVIPVEQRVGAPMRQAGMGLEGPPTRDLAHLAAGVRLDEALTEAAYCGLPVST